MDVLVPVLFVGGMFAALVAAIVFSNHMRKKSIAEWTAYANENGFTLGGGYPGWRLEGTVDGVKFWVEHTTHRGSKGQIHYTAHIAAMAQGPIGDLSVTPEGFFDKIFGPGDLKVGDDAFDRRYIIRGTSIDIVHRALNPNVRQMLLGPAGSNGVHIVDGAFRITRGGSLDLAFLKRILPVLVRLSHATR